MNNLETPPAEDYSFSDSLESQEHKELAPVIQLRGYAEIFKAEMIIGPEDPIGQKLDNLLTNFEHTPPEFQVVQLEGEEGLRFRRVLKDRIQQPATNNPDEDALKEMAKDLFFGEYSRTGDKTYSSRVTSPSTPEKPVIRPIIELKTQIRRNESGFEITLGNFRDANTALGNIDEFEDEDRYLLHSTKAQDKKAVPTLPEQLKVLVGEVDGEPYTYSGEQAKVIIGALSKAAIRHREDTKRLEATRQRQAELEQRVSNSTGLKQKVAEIALQRNKPKLLELTEESKSAAAFKHAVAEQILHPSRASKAEIANQSKSRHLQAVANSTAKDSKDHQRLAA